jgi:molybdate transport system substrate-binding protein
MRLLSLAGAATLALLASCGPRQPAEARPLLVLAASDLQLALPEIAAAFRARTGTEVELVLGSTGNLATQIENGAPADIFLAASEPFMDRLARGGLIVEETRAVYALGRLALVWREGAPEPAGPAALAGPAYRTIANPEHAPYGMAAREALTAAGAWDGIGPRLVLGENVAQALQFVRTGNADAGVVALGAVATQREVPHRAVDAALHAPLRQTGAVLRGSARPDDAAAFLREMTGPAGQAILRRHGFDAPDAP